MALSVGNDIMATLPIDSAIQMSSWVFARARSTCWTPEGSREGSSSQQLHIDGVVQKRVATDYGF